MFFKEAWKNHNFLNDNLGQGNDYMGLGDIYLKSNKLKYAEAVTGVGCDT